MKLYRIITENKNYQDIIVYLMEHRLDATIIQSNSLWQGRAEKSIVIEISECTEVKWQNPIANEVEKLAYWLKKHNKQPDVLLQEINCEQFSVNHNLWLM